MNKNLDPVDFERKRFEFWLEKVPPDIRRWEYDLWKRYKILAQIGYRTYLHMKDKGRAVPMPGFTSEIQEKDWLEFSNTFLTGHERATRFQELLQQVGRDWEKMPEDYSIDVKSDDIGIVALEGSGFYGPRKANTPFSDIDVKILLKTSDGSRNFEIMPSVKNSDKPYYHIIGTGKTDEGRFYREDIHWLLYPHFPIINTFNKSELDKIISDLVVSTHQRKEMIEDKISTLNGRIEKRREEFILK